MVKAVLETTPKGFKITVLPNEAVIPEPTVEQQAVDIRLGVMAASSSMSTFVKALNQLMALGTGNDTQPFMLKKNDFDGIS